MPPIVRLVETSTALGLLVLAGISPSVAQGAAGGRAGSPPLFHSHWCGAGDQNRAAPVDALDAACRAHDLCYKRVGRNACSCDRAFLEATANSLFSAAPCRGAAEAAQGARIP